MRRLEDRIALVTGAGAGIGRAIGAAVRGRGRPRLRHRRQRRGAADGGGRDRAGRGLGATAMTADVSRGQDVTAMFRAIEKAHGRLDVLVNNAGLNVRSDFRHLTRRRLGARSARSTSTASCAWRATASPC